MLFAVMLVGVTATLIGALSYTRARRAMETTAKTRLVLLARDVAAHLRRELEDRAADITNWSHLEVMRALIYRDVDKELARFLEQTLQGRPTYVGILALDADGRLVAAAGEAHVPHRTAAPADEPRLSIVRRPDRPLLELATTVPHPERPTDAIGTLILVLDPRGVLDGVQGSVRSTASFASLALRTEGGDTIATALPERPDAPESRHLTTALPIGAVAGVQAPELDVLVSEPAAAAFADIESLRATLLGTGALVVVIGALLGALVAWRMGRPIRELTATVREIAKRGEPEPHASFPEAGGEVGVLAAAFRTMMESLATAQREAVERSRLAFLGEIAANVAHEVRTPLSVLKTAAQLLARDGLPAAEQRELASTAAAEVDRLNAVVTNLVDLARPKPVRYSTEPIDTIVDRAVALFRPLAARHGVAITRVATDGGLAVRADADQLHQVFLNLLQNAIHAMHDGGALGVRTHAEDGSVVVEVDDTGPGFAADVLPRVFTPFVTTKPDGTGLGLALVKRMVEEHGGAVGAENLPAGGARVWIRLPVTEAA